HELVAGFLLSEGVIHSRADLGTIAHCGRPGDEGYGNVIDVSPAPGVTLDPESLRGNRRGTLTTAACGVCGRVTIEDLLERMGKLEDDARFDAGMIAHLTDRLREQQPAFARTGGLHAAAIVSAGGDFQVT